MNISQVVAQLYTVRDWLKTPKDIASSLSRIRKIGYESVQLSGLGPIETDALKKILSDEGLSASSTHEDSNQILEDPAGVAKNLKALGCTLTAYPFPRDISFGSLKEVKDFAARLNNSGRVLHEEGITLAYHNHNIEFVRVENRPILEILYDETDPKYLQGEIDTYWVQAGGANPVEWCAKLKGRLPLLHIKDFGVNAERQGVFREIGQGNLDWPLIIRTAEESGCSWFIVEQDSNWFEDDPFKSLKMSFDYIKANLVS